MLLAPAEAAGRRFHLRKLTQHRWFPALKLHPKRLKLRTTRYTMKAHFRLLAIGGALLAAATGFGQTAAPTPPPPPPSAPQTLHVLISAPLGRGGENLYDRVAADYGYVFRHQKWPLKISMEEFGGGHYHDPLELDVFVERIRQWLPHEWTFAAWTTLKIGNQKHDLGIIQYVYDRPAFEQPDISLDNLVQGAARATAKKIEPFLFPGTR